MKVTNRLLAVVVVIVILLVIIVSVSGIDFSSKFDRLVRGLPVLPGRHIEFIGINDGDTLSGTIDILIQLDSHKDVSGNYSLAVDGRRITTPLYLSRDRLFDPVMYGVFSTNMITNGKHSLNLIDHKMNVLAVKHVIFANP